MSLETESLIFYELTFISIIFLIIGITYKTVFLFRIINESLTLILSQISFNIFLTDKII